MWYKREEQSLLNSIWYCMSGVQLIVCGVSYFSVSQVLILSDRRPSRFWCLPFHERPDQKLATAVSGARSLYVPLVGRYRHFPSR